MIFDSRSNHMFNHEFCLISNHFCSPPFLIQWTGLINIYFIKSLLTETDSNVIYETTNRFLLVSRVLFKFIKDICIYTQMFNQHICFISKNFIGCSPN